MTRKLPLAVALIMGLFIAASASATTYYIAANGNDSNDGTSTSSPWLHAPGMTGCSGTCASTTPQPGDNFILRGGDSWHYNSAQGSPVGLPWNWKWNGSSSSCQLNAGAGTVAKTSCIYIGVSESWYSGSSWARPKLNLDNALSTSRPSSCRYDDTSVNAVNLGGQSSLIFDNFELLGACWQGNTNSSWVTSYGTQVELSNNYIHGWTYGSNSSADDYAGFGGNMPKANYILCDHNVFDGVDSSLGATQGAASGMAIYNTCKEISYNVFSHVSNGCICNPASVHDNLFQYLYEPQGAQHGNIIETNTAQSVTGPVYFYNNVMRHTNEGVGVWLETVNENMYIFNNVSWHYRESTSTGANGTDGSNCYMVDQSSTSVQAYFFNNTNDYPCNFSTLNGAMPTISFANNYYIGYPSSSLSSTYSMAAPTVDLGHELFQSESAANSEGYTTNNNYAPTSSGDATVGFGQVLSSSICNTMLNGSASAACKNGMVGVTYDSLNHAPVAGQLVARNSSWDVGAYEFSQGSVSNQPAPPSGLSASVQ
jgi:hypothetical protein